MIDQTRSRVVSPVSSRRRHERCFSRIYMVGLTLDWLKSEGGLEELEKSNNKKSQMVYEAIESSDGFYV